MVRTHLGSDGGSPEQSFENPASLEDVVIPLMMPVLWPSVPWLRFPNVRLGSIAVTSGLCILGYVLTIMIVVGKSADDIRISIMRNVGINPYLAPASYCPVRR